MMIVVAGRAWVIGRSVRLFHFGSRFGPCGGGWGLGGCGWSEGRVEQLCPGRVPGPVGREVHPELAGGVGEPAGTLMSWARMVLVVARAWNAEARQPAARVRLTAIAAIASQAELAWNDPEGRCAKDPFFRSAWTCSMMA